MKIEMTGAVLAAVLSGTVVLENTITDAITKKEQVTVGKPASMSLEGVTNVVWDFGSTNLLHLTLSTNLQTNWVTVEELEVISTNKVRVRQVGFIFTNRMLWLSYGEATNYAVKLDILGKEEWPSGRRVEVVAPSVRR